MTTKIPETLETKIERLVREHLAGQQLAARAAVERAFAFLIDRHARAPKVTYPKLEVVYASGAALAHGVETRTIEGIPVRLTTPAKTVADCFRYRRHVGLEVALAALRGYLRRPVARGSRRTGSTIDDLVAAARADRVSSLLRPYLEALL